MEKSKNGMVQKIRSGSQKKVAMYTVSILLFGKKIDQAIQTVIDTYIQRLSYRVEIKLVYMKPKSGDLKGFSNLILLDAQGMQMTSEKLSEYLFDELQKNKGSLTFVIGPAEGFSNEVKRQYPALSLSTLTFPHMLCPLLLIEQIYRAFELQRGSPYHK